MNGFIGWHAIGFDVIAAVLIFAALYGAFAFMERKGWL